MAMCETCKISGYEAKQMFVRDESKFVGPCCMSSGDRPVAPPDGNVIPLKVLELRPGDDIEYGVTVSNKVGVKAFAQYGGLGFVFERSPEQLKQWAERNGIVLVGA